MPLTKKNLFVKRSGIPKAGKGLFTKTHIPKGTRILEYQGQIRTWKEALESSVFNGYVYYVNRNYVIDAKDNLESLGRYVNDANGLTKIKGLVNNSKYVQEGRRVFVQAIKDIPEGSEVFVSYEKDYWDVIKYNNRIIAQHRKESKKTLR
ncbi:MAG: SET domain-containing protein-lysine N-methyltransferase [Ginsengibacter sp.]